MKKTVTKSHEVRHVTAHVKKESSSWFAALKNSWRGALRIDRSQITAIQAIRRTIGFVLPLAIGVLTGHVIEGVSMAGGAAMLGPVGLNYTYRARVRTMLLACFGIALSVFVGATTSHIDWLAILVAGIWGIAAGLLVSISQPAMVIGLQSVVALIIFYHFELDPLQAALQAGLLFAGALLQVVLAIIPLPWQDTAPERAALAERGDDDAWNGSNGDRRAAVPDFPGQCAVGYGEAGAGGSAGGAPGSAHGIDAYPGRGRPDDRPGARASGGGGPASGGGSGDDVGNLTPSSEPARSASRSCTRPCRPDRRRCRCRSAHIGRARWTRP